MKPMELNEMEKGEYSELLHHDDDLVKPVSAEPRKWRRGRCTSWPKCLLWTIVVLFAVMLMTMAGAYCWMSHQVRRFTVADMDDLPRPPLPVSPLPKEQLEIIKDEAKLFWDQIHAGVTPREDLVLTQDAFNGLIADSDYLRGHAHVTLTKNQGYAELALPADFLPGGKGRFFVGNAMVETPVNTGKYSTTQKIASQVITTKITPKHPVRGLDFATILAGEFLTYKSENKVDGTLVPIMELVSGQFLNWVAPYDWIDHHENLLRCDNWDCSSSSSSSSDSSDDGDKDEGCQEFMDTLARIESITLEDEKIVIRPHREDDNNKNKQAAAPALSSYESEDNEPIEEHENNAHMRPILDESSSYDNDRRQLLQGTKTDGASMGSTLARRLLRKVLL